MTRFLLSSTVLLLLAACGGNKGGGSLFVPEVPFTSFAAVQPQTTVVMSNGFSSATSGNYTAGIGGITITVPGTGLSIADDTTAANTMKLTYDSSRLLTGVSFSTPNGEASFSLGGTTTFGCTAGVCTAHNSGGDAVVIDGITFGWNYQTFGVWNRLASSTVFQAGAISAGAVTPASAVPASGNAVFTGTARGFYTPAAGTPFSTTANMSANVDWGAKSIMFTTTGTTVTNLNTGGAPVANAGLNLTGTLTYSPVTNSFTGSVTPATVAMTGAATGRFYGPAAQEIGGTYSLTGAGGTMVGGFGGKR